MSGFRLSGWCALVFAGLCSARMLAAGQTTPPAAAPPAPTSPAPPAVPPATTAPGRQAAPSTAPADQQSAPAPEVSQAELDRIKRRMLLPPTLKLDDQQLRYYVQILAKQQSFAASFATGYDWKNGATRGGNPMTHQEFLSMVTPKEFYSSGGITATELLQGAIVNWLGQALIKRALDEVSHAHSEKELRDIRDRIDRELAMLKRPGG